MKSGKLAGLIGGLAASAMLAGCSGSDDHRPVSSETNSKVSVPSRTETVTSTTEPVVGTSPGTEVASQPPTPSEIHAAWQEGVSLYESGNFEAASVRLQIAATGRPSDPYVQYLDGLSLWKSGHLAESEAALLRSAAINDSSLRTFVNLARVRLDRDDSAGALQAADRALQIGPGDGEALHQRGRALDGLNRGDEAMSTLQQAREALPDNGYIANTLGYLMLRRGRIEEAIPHLEAARTALPGVAFVRNNLGVAYERHGDLDAAVAEFQAAVEAGDSNGKASQSLARLEPVVERVLAGRTTTPSNGIPSTGTTPDPAVVPDGSDTVADADSGGGN
jgi:Flp pilus assembly protein TadD